ncbi:MAG: hypothetical protein R3F61_29905 [Myxococcota bacterium]
MLLASSWFTLVLFVVLDVFNIDVLPNDSVDGMLGIPGLFRIVGWASWCAGGTWVAAVGLAVDLAFTVAVLGDQRTDLKESLLIAALVLSSAIPAWWSLRERKPAALFGIAGTLMALLAWPLIDLHLYQNVVMALITGSVVMSVLADAAIAVWALRAWRDRTLAADREFS